MALAIKRDGFARDGAPVKARMARRRQLPEWRPGVIAQDQSGLLEIPVPAGVEISGTAAFGGDAAIRRGGSAAESHIALAAAGRRQHPAPAHVDLGTDAAGMSRLLRAAAVKSIDTLTAQPASISKAPRRVAGRDRIVMPRTVIAGGYRIVGTMNFVSSGCY